MKGWPPDGEGVSGDAERFENKRWSEGFLSLWRGEGGAEPAELRSNLWDMLASDRLGSDKVGIDRAEEIGVAGELLDMEGNCIGEPRGPVIVGRRGGRLNCGSGEFAMTSEANEGLVSKPFSSRGRCSKDGPLEGVASDSAEEESKGDGASRRGSIDASSEVDTDETSSE
jgi:hypothetical protein